ncbi:MULTISPECIES: Flp family type IVb pilin [unclassified Agromyces]|uniref:Flp family type IVb pilin n=1 Tax=unclassified Agromyces TaxID=2639701 RepID=UPI0030149153
MSKLLAKAQTSLTKRLETLREQEEGATAVEYALIVGLVSLIIIAALALIGPAVATFVTTDILPKL